MNWNDWRCRSQITLRRAPRTGMQQAKREKTGARLSPAGVSSIIRAAALRNRFAERPADVAGGAVGPALDEAREGLLGERRGVEEAIGHGHQPLPLRRESREEVGFRRIDQITHLVVHRPPFAGGAPPLFSPAGSCRVWKPFRTAPRG